MVTETLSCPLCGPGLFKRLFVKKERAFWRCGKCSLELQHPLPTQDELRDYYEQSFASGMYLDFTSANLMKEMTARQRLKEIRKRISISGRWLDVGCANGVFVKTLADNGVDAEGIELSDHAVKAAKDAGLNVKCAMLSDVPADETFDCITAFDVLEHVLDPVAFVGETLERLKPGGHAVFTLPNTGGIVRRIMGRRWYFYIPEEHLHFFSSKNLESFLKKSGFETVQIGATFKPMTYDYALTQFSEFNPLIYRVLNTVGWIIPKAIRRWPVPLPIGELRAIARKP